MSRVRAKPKQEQPVVPIEWPRADPVELANFDPATKLCSMNCSKSGLDPRSYNELRFLCDECYTCSPKPKPPAGNVNDLIEALAADEHAAWLFLARKAGKTGVRYGTNKGMVEFLRALADHLPTGIYSEVGTCDSCYAEAHHPSLSSQ